MKLVALWVENYMRIKCQLFNFGSKFTYNFHFDHENRVLQLNVVDTLEFYQLFKEKEGITNITGIVGVNGSGKTSMLKLLNVIKAKKPLEASVVLVFEDVFTIEVKVYQTVYSAFSKSKPVTVSYKKSGNDIPKNLNVNINNNHPDPLRKIDIIFYSNLYSDQNDKYLEINSELNRSVDYRTREALSPNNVSRYLETYENIPNTTFLKEEGFNILKLYEDEKQKRLFKFLCDIHSKHEDIKGVISNISFPEQITVWFKNNNEILIDTEKLIKTSQYDFKALIPIYHFCEENNQNSKNPRERFKNELIYKLFFLSFYNDFFNKSNPPIHLVELEMFVKALKLDSSIFENLYNYLLEQNAAQHHDIAKIRSILANVDELLRSIEISYSKTALILDGAYKITINGNLWKFLSAIGEITDYKYEAIIGHSLNPFSSGENAILNQFSELYASFKHISEEDILISIDEGELYLHPEWQRQYINSLYLFLEYFNKNILSNANIQVLVTSHSPFIISDIPRHNLIFIEKDLVGNSVVSSSTRHLPTFGGNIFELFSDSFFVNEFISEFAFIRINEALKFLHGEPSIFTDIQEVDSFSQIIGETLIREQLKKMIERIKSENFDKYYEILKQRDKLIVDKPKVKNKSKQKK